MLEEKEQLVYENKAYTRKDCHTMEYYKRQKTAINTFYNNLDQLVAKYSHKKDWIMFGSNRICGMIISYLDTKGVNVSAIVDNDVTRQGGKVFGLDVYKPEKLLQPYRDGMLVLIASSHQEAMISQLEDMGYKYEIDIEKVLDLPELMSNYDFEDRTGYKRMTVEEVRKCQVDILEYLHNVCIENGLRYWISGGTLIGAIRHKGFIPWDDDIDVIMELNDLKKLSSILKEDKRYKLISMFDEELDYFDDCSLLVDTETIMDINRFPMQGTTGISIDIFVLTGIPDGQAGKDYMLKAKQLETECYNSLYSVKECRKKINKLIEFLSDYNFDDYKKAGAVLGVHFYKEILDRSDFEEHVELLFENRVVWAPKGYENYLTQIFGDYLKLPPKEQQVPHHYFKAYWKKGEKK